MFGFTRNKDLAALAERVHNDNALDARICAPMQPVSYEDHKKAAYWSGYVDGSRELLFAIRAFMFGGKRRKNARKSVGATIGRPRVKRKIDGRAMHAPTGSVRGASVCREFETVVTVCIHEISKDVKLPACFEVGAYKLGVEDRIRRVLREADIDGDKLDVKVQVFMKDEGEC